ncbi:Zinc finger ZZ-type and EF-hand domain-containing protein 1 [Trichoplax sp. H2]|nr:Zinc finger ZZ-type and EF-hand domain-containing protein 1 [Trichoplax sp. H2]|eukprot:RDD38126.1 Zinc finger ZZ-type and EF-hand domain-containing protein 1 [Trichoplax sp. H2]
MEKKSSKKSLDYVCLSLNTELVNNEEICDLFNLESLRKFVTSSDKVELSISDVLSTTIAWLEDRAERRENSVTKFQFINFLESHGLTAEKGAEAFDQLDIEGQGIINSKDFMELFKQRFRSQNDELNGSNYMFTTCPLTPGRVNALTNEGKRKDLYRSLMKYIINNQISATSVPFPPLNYINDSFALRDKAIAKIMGEMSLKVASTTYDDSGEKQIRTLCLKCHQKLEVSSNSDTLNNLLDGNFHTCWQSDGITGTHWIRLSIKPDVELTELSIYVVPVDQSYMPKQVSVSAGFDADSVNIVSTVTIPNSHHGYFKVYERHSNFSYTVFQINIQRCHSGGCDTRIRGIKTIGYRYAKPAPELNIVSSSITWLLSIVTETVKAALPVSPSLKKALLNHAKIALRDFKPLCLSTTQNLIKYLSNRTQESIENFLYALIDDNDPNTKAEVLECFLTFSLATADLGSIIRALNLLVDNSETKLKCRELLVSMYAEYYKLLRSSRDALDISLFYCDVQAKDDQNLADTVLQDSGTFSTATGEKKATLVFTCKKEAHVLQLTALKFKTAKGSTCPKYCLVFVINDNRNDSSFCLKSLLNDLKKYDDMTTEQYEKMIHDRRTKSPYDKSNLNPVVCMDFMSDRYETFVEMDVIRTGKYYKRVLVGNYNYNENYFCQYVVVKLLGTQGDEADRLSIRSIKFLGFSYPKIPEFDYINVDAVAPIPDSAAAPIEADSVVLRVTNLICSCLLKQRNLRKQSTVSKNKFFHDNNSLNLSTIWKLYSFYTKRNDNKGKLAKILILRVLYLTLPRLKTSESWKELQNDSNESNNDNSANKDATVASRQEMFSHLCSLVNDNSINSTEVFFPRPETCCQYLAELLDELKIKISTGRRSDHSVAVTLRSLCRYFISGHAMFLLKLPENVTSESDLSHALKIIQKVLELSFRECESIMRAYHYHDEEYKPTGITQLLNVLQRYLFSWCYNQLRKPITDIKIRRQIEDLINKYTTVVVKRMNICLEVLLQDAVNKEQVVLWTRHTFLSVTCRELMLLLPFIVKEVNTIHKFVVDTFQPITVKLIKLAAVLPKLFFTLNDLAWECVEDKVELRIWNEESNHNYENNLHVTKTFYCPGAHSFVVEFDERCRTERSFDYLEFVDKTGNTKRFDYKVGFEKWPTKATFQGHNLRFTFNSDSSNTDWGYKFKVSAFGYKLASLPWLFDLFLSHGRLIGFLCRELYIGSSRRKLLTKDTTSTTDEPTLEDNKIWQTIFRGGIEVGKTLTRSLSGYHSSEGSKSSSSFEFISDLAKNEGDAEKLLKRCRKILGYQSIGGNLVNCTVDATFAALIWHNQYLRDDILKIVNADQSPAMIPPGILCAMAAAENFRKDLVSRKQRIIASQDTSDINNNSVGDELNTSTSDDYVISCWNKAQFLLKLSSQPSNIATLAKSHGNLTVNEKRQLHQKLRLHFGIKVVPASLEKLTSNELDYLRDNFKIILGFIRSSKINVNEVEESFHARTYRAKNLIHTFNQATEYLKALMKEDTTSLPAIVFLEYLLQDQKDFPSHFLDGVEGCGLELEKGIRRTFYSLVRYLIRYVQKLLSKNERKSGYEIILFLFTRLMLIQWKMEDFKFLQEINAAETLFRITIDTAFVPALVGTRENPNELDTYRQHRSYAKEAVKDFDNWFSEFSELSDANKEVHMFIAQNSDVMDVKISCDGCERIVSGRRFRSLTCRDLDLCTDCYISGVRPEEHMGEYEVVEF